MTYIECPICAESIELEDAQTSSNLAAAPAIAQAMGVTADALISIHTSQAAHRNETTLNNHFRTHGPNEWLPALMDARRRAITAEQHSAGIS